MIKSTSAERKIVILFSDSKLTKPSQRWRNRRKHKWYRYGFEFVLFGYFIPLWILINVIIYFIMISVFLRNGMTSKTHSAGSYFFVAYCGFMVE
jgi:polyferredoxin